MSKLGAGGGRGLHDDCANFPYAANCAPRQTSTPVSTPNAEVFFEGNVLSEFEAKIAEEIGGEVRALDLIVYESFVKTQVQDPQKKENVDSYTYKNGGFEAPVPVRLSGSGSLEQNLFKLKEVNLARIPELIDEAREKSQDLEGAKVSHVIIKKDLPFSNKIKIRVYVSGTRKSAWLVADADGKVIEYKTF